MIWFKQEIERILEQASMEDHSDADCILVTGIFFIYIYILLVCLSVLYPINCQNGRTTTKFPKKNQ